jgi:cytochrome b involved in lipid metabolism
MQERRSVINRIGIAEKNCGDKNEEEEHNNENLLELKEFTRESIAFHNNESNGLFIIFENKVYNVTDFARIHPGGHKIIESVAGMDATMDIKNAHGKDLARIKTLMAKYCVGFVKESTKDSKWSKILELIAET